MAFAGTFLSKFTKHIHDLESLPTSGQTPTDAGGSSNNGADSSISHTPNSNEYTEADYPGVLDSELTALSLLQKNIFIVTLIILFVLSMFGNMCTLFVNARRKIRPFFRACLISLALSDLMNTIFLTTAYMSQFTAEYVQVWRLGSLMCGFVPFATTAAILASSMTLVGIAVDRYYAVMKAVIGFWNPSIISCIVCMCCIWIASFGIACPVFTIYDIIPVYILTEEDTTSNVASWSKSAASAAAAAGLTTTENGLVFLTPKKPNNTAKTTLAETGQAVSIATKTPWEVEASVEDLSYTLVREQKLVNMCISDQNDVTLYYAIVFAIIFIPCLGAFFWFNSIIARKLWKRRHSAAISKRKSHKMPKSKTKSKSNATAVNIELQNAQSLPQTKQPTTFTQQNKNCNCKSGHSSSTTMPSSMANTLGGNVTVGATGSSSTTTSVSVNSSREARHLRMFTIILLMMAVFVFLRLPAWIFLLMRMYGSYTKPIDWILYFVFGILNVASSVLNPLFYTFLTETIQYVLRFKVKVASVICSRCSRICCCCFTTGRYGSKKNTSNSSTTTTHPGGGPPVIMENVKEPLHTISCCENFCGCSGFMRATWQCYRPQSEAEQHQQMPPLSLQLQNEICSKDSGQALNMDNDEGVDCSDDVDCDEDIRDFYDYNQRIYTIFPPSLVSSSLNSQ